VMRDQVVDKLLHLRTADIQSHPTLRAARANVSFLVGNEIGIGEDRAVFKVVDAQRDRLVPGDGAEMASQFEVAGMRLLNPPPPGARTQLCDMFFIP
jgi:hypothetical protein